MFRTLRRLGAKVAPRRRIQRFVHLADEPAIGRLIGAPPMDLDIEASSEELQEILLRTEGLWSEIGRQAPYFSVISNDAYRALDFDKERFYSSGGDDLATLEAFFKRAGEPLGAVRDVLEFGCGVGRNTLFLAERFDRVVAVDISTPHLDIAKSKLLEAKKTNVSFVHGTSINQIAALPISDMILSLIVLQHNCPPVIWAILRELLNRVRPDGYAYFQVPVYIRDYTFSVRKYLNGEHSARPLQMHPLPQRFILKLLRELDFEVLEIQEDRAALGQGMISNIFFAKRG